MAFPLTLTQTLSTPASPHAVWRALEAVERWPECMPHLVAASREPDGPLAPGSSIALRAPGLTGALTRVEQVLAVEPPQRLVLAVDDSDYRATTEYRIAAGDDGTTDLAVTGTLEARGFTQTVRFLLWHARLAPILTTTLRERGQALVTLAERIAAGE